MIVNIDGHAVVVHVVVVVHLHGFGIRRKRFELRLRQFIGIPGRQRKQQAAV